MQPQEGEYLPVAGPTKDECTWSMLCHLSIVAQIFFPVLIIAPLLILLFKGDQLPLVKQQGKEAINFQITLFLAACVCGFLSIIGIGVLLAIALWIYSIVAGVIATVKVKEGVPYRYGFNLRLIK
jgi:uncharacterized Tic20 family protein